MMEPNKSGRWSQFVCILLLSDYGPVALFMALQLIADGLWLANPWYDTFESSRTYDAMQFIAPEPVWAAWFVLLGAALLFYTCLSHHHRARMITTFLVALTWYFCTAMFFYSNPPVLGVVVFSTNAIAASWLYLRTRIYRSGRVS